MDKENKIRDAADAVKGIVQAVPVYQDVVQPAAKEIGTGLQTVAKTIHILLAPVSTLIWGYETVKGFVLTEVGKKLKDVPPERLISPAPNVAGPAIEALRYTGFEPSLRDLYAKLLATSMDNKTAHEAHPSFVEIIKQLSPDEAYLMKSFVRRIAFPALTVRAERKEGRGGYWTLRHFSLLPYDGGCKYSDLGPNYLVNLQRLGLLELREDYKLREDGIYKQLEEHPVIKKAVVEIEKQPDRKPNLEYGAAILTPFGQQFVTACVEETISQA